MIEFFDRLVLLVFGLISIKCIKHYNTEVYYEEICVLMQGNLLLVMEEKQMPRPHDGPTICEGLMFDSL